MASNGFEHQAPNQPFLWCPRREPTGIAAVIVVLVLGALVTASCGQTRSSTPSAVLSSPAATRAASPAAASPAVSARYPPLPSYTRFNPGAQSVYAAGLGKHVNLTAENDGYTWTLHWVYADAVQVLVFYSITPPANTNIKILANDVKVTADNGSGYPRSPVYSVSGTGDAGSTVGPNGQADFFATILNVEPISNEPDSIAFTLTFTGVADVINAEEGHKVADGTIMHVTVPFEAGRTIPVNMQGTVRGAAVHLDQIVVAPSGEMAFLSYPAFPAANPATSQGINGIQPTFNLQLSDGSSWQSKAPGFFSIPATAIWFLHPPPTALSGNWTLTLQPYGTTKNLITDPSQWLTFTFPIGPPRATTAIPSQIQNVPVARMLYTAGLGASPNRSMKVGGATAVLQWVYADAHQVWAAYSVTGLPENANTMSAAAHLGARTICGSGSLSVKPDSGSAKMLAGSESGGPAGGSTQRCLISQDEAFSGNTHSVELTVRGSTSNESGAFSLSATIPIVEARTAAVHKTARLYDMTLTLDGVSVTPTGMRLYFAGAVTADETVFTSYHYLVNGEHTSISTAGTTSTEWSTSGDKMYDLGYSNPGWPKPWTIKIVVDSTTSLIFTFTLPPASWDSVFSPPATPAATPMP